MNFLSFLLVGILLHKSLFSDKRDPMTTALEKINEIQERANAEILQLRREAVSEVVKKISETKATLAELEAQYIALTGKDLRGESAAAPEAKRRTRMSPDDKATLVDSIKGLLKGKKTGVPMRDILSQTGVSVGQARAALAEIKEIRTTGNKASTLYFLR